MYTRFEKAFAGVLLFACAAAGVFVSVRSSPSAKEQQIVFASAGGAVVFDHRFHASTADCVVCHHNIEPEELEFASAEDMNCRGCHYFDQDKEVKPEGKKPHLRLIGSACVSCHKGQSDDLADCSVCHLPSGQAFRLTARRMQPLPKVFAFKVEAGMEAGGGNVVFDHTHHAKEFDCEKCHHDDRGWPVPGVSADASKCRACHYSDSMKKMTSGDEHHKRFIGGSCVDCHAEILSSDKQGCPSCHLSPEREAARLALGPVKPMPKKRILMDVSARDSQGAKRANVVFDHPFHAASFDCSECHHEKYSAVEGVADEGMNCRACHYSEAMSGLKSSDDSHQRFVGASCVDCHKKQLPKEYSRCQTCHIPPEDEDAALAAPPKKPMPRGRMVMEVSAEHNQAGKRGNVVFDHKYHAASFDCIKCHHHSAVEIEGVAPDTRRCRDCHYDDTMIDLPSPDSHNHKRFIGYSCVECHTEMLPKERQSCSECHLTPQAQAEKVAEPSAPPLPRELLVLKIAAEKQKEGANGDVAFDHAYHADAFSCAQCHHKTGAIPEVGAGENEKRCRICHYSPAMKDVANPDLSPHTRLVGASCVQCHRDILDHQKRACWNCHLSRERIAERIHSEPLRKMPERVTFRQDSEKGKKRGDVKFDHKFHMASFTCDACHHPVVGGKGSLADASQRNCRTCHYSEAMKELESPDPIHSRFVGANCRNCHKKIDMEKRKCETCHIDPEAEARTVEERDKLPGIISIAMTSEKGKEVGGVKFDHKYHYGTDAGIECSACHHEFKGGESMKGMERERNCRSCHYSDFLDGVESKDPLHPRFVGATCYACHKNLESKELQSCSTCHMAEGKNP